MIATTTKSSMREKPSKLLFSIFKKQCYQHFMQTYNSLMRAALATLNEKFNFRFILYQHRVLA